MHFKLYTVTKYMQINIKYIYQKKREKIYKKTKKTNQKTHRKYYFVFLCMVGNIN